MSKRRVSEGAALRTFGRKFVVSAAGCWEWNKTIDRDGYGRVGGKIKRQAGRAMWEVLHGPVPAEAEVCHTCDNRRCVNPAHLFLGSHADNMGDMVQKDRQVKGEAQPGAKLTVEGVRWARQQWAAGATIQGLQRIFAVCNKTMADALKGRTWAHVV